LVLVKANKYHGSIICFLYFSLTPREFNSYGARRGNDDVMARGTFANIRLINQLVAKAGPRTIHIPSGEEMDIFDAAELYRKENRQLIVITGKEYGTGSSRDWAAKGPWKLGVKGKNGLNLAAVPQNLHRYI